MVCDQKVGSRVGHGCASAATQNLGAASPCSGASAWMKPYSLLGICAARRKQEKGFEGGKKPAVGDPRLSQLRSQREKPRPMLAPGQGALCPEKTCMRMLIITTSKRPNVYIPGETEKQRVSICHQPSLAKMQHPKYYFESRLAIPGQHGYVIHTRVTSPDTVPMSQTCQHLLCQRAPRCFLSG